MRRLGLSFAASVVVCAQPALADDIVHYGAEPVWVDVYDKGRIDLESSSPLPVLDIQQRIEQGTVAVYADQALKLDSPVALTQAGTSVLTWQPDKGTLTVHRVEILRGDETIDVLADGSVYTVLRRETRLEQRLIDGSLTATMPVPGLQIGDVLRISFTQTLKDDALQGQVQQVSPLLIKPVEATFGRLKLSWPKDETVHWTVGPDDVEAREASEGQFHSVEIDLPLAKREDLPFDAPMSVTRPPIFQATTFSDWQAVSSVFASVYDPAQYDLSEASLSEEIASIRQQSDDPLQQAALATQLVQNKIGYLLNGMAGGNYIPQAPAETWTLRYGDCKAKTLLLLSILHELGIPAEAALVHSSLGDAVSDLLPMAADFDHVLVRATIDGKDYWLDGTSSGTRLANIADTPGFRYFLPIRAEGSDLLALEPRIPSVPTAAMAVTLDQRAGIDFPSIADIEVRLTGPIASTVGALAKQANDEQKKDFVDGFAQSTLGSASIADGSFSYDEETGVATIGFTAVHTSPWRSDGGRKRQRLTSLPSADLDFDPDRSRPAWRDIPVNLGVPALEAYNLQILLPDDEPGYLVRGRPDIDIAFAGNRVVRTAELAGSTFTASERVESLGGELPASELPAEKAKAQRVKNSAPFLLAPIDAPRSWEYGRPELRKRTVRLEEEYQKVIDRDPDEAWTYLNRARFRFGATDFDGALDDYTKAIALDSTADNFVARASVYHTLGEMPKSLQDARKAFEISPSADNALLLASYLGEVGETDEAIALIDEFDDYGENHESFVQTRADILAYGGRLDEGLTELDALIEERPAQGHLYNASCWYRARFDVGLDGIGAVCDRAVTQGSSAASALDSRAMAWLKAGELGKALEDADAAIALRPQFRQTHYLKAFVQRAMGDEAGEQQIRYLSQTFPGMAQEYARYGLKP